MDRRPAVPTAIRNATRRAGTSWVYEYSDRDDFLLYVGIAIDPPHRARHHRGGAPWWRFVASGRVWPQPGYGSAKVFERELIETCGPLFNKIHAPWWMDFHAIEYCAHREAWDLVDALTEGLLDPPPDFDYPIPEHTWAVS